MKQQKGFTLIELIVVVVILGILAATALPRFTGMTADARAAKMQGIAAAIQAAATMTHGQAFAEQAVSNGSVTLENGQVVLMSWYYPNSVGIRTAIDLDSTVSYGASGNGVAFFFDSNRTKCAILYNEALSASIPASVVNTSVIGSANIAANCV